MEDHEYPSFIKGVRILIASTGSEFQWSSGDSYTHPNIVDIVNGIDDSFIKTTEYNKLATFKLIPIDESSAIGFEGVNVFIEGSAVIESSDSVYLNTYFSQESSGSVNQQDNSSISDIEALKSYSALEKDGGGKLTIDDINSGSINILTRKFINKNFFGSEQSEDQSFETTQSISTSGDFVFLNYKNLFISNESLITTNNPCKGLVIYVKENCIIEGSISMDSKGISGSFEDHPIDLWKNISESFDFSGSKFATGSTWDLEIENQPYSSDFSDWFGLNSLTPSGESNLVGGGGSGGSSSLNGGGLGGSSSYWAGGL